MKSQIVKMGKDGGEKTDFSVKLDGERLAKLFSHDKVGETPKAKIIPFMPKKEKTQPREVKANPFQTSQDQVGTNPDQNQIETNHACQTAQSIFKDREPESYPITVSEAEALFKDLDKILPSDTPLTAREWDRIFFAYNVLSKMPLWDDDSDVILLYESYLDRIEERIDRNKRGRTTVMAEGTKRGNLRIL